MFDGLPTPDDRPFAPGIAPVQTVLFELDFQEERPLKSDDGLRWQRNLHSVGLETVRLAPANQRSVRLQTGAGQPRVAATLREGWLVHLTDTTSNSGLYSTGVNLERHNYPGFDEFRSECVHIVDSTLSLFQPKVQTRISLTYANALSDERARSQAFWQGKVSPAFLGPISSDDLLPDFVTGFSIFTFATSSYEVELTVAIQPDQVFEGRHAFVFQSQARTQGIKELIREDVIESLDELHVILLKLFYAVLEPEYAQEMHAARARDN
jgi:uncharacterized protein (TIGR04255 family)